MMNDVRALCDAPHVPGLVDFVGAYHEAENGQVHTVYTHLTMLVWPDSIRVNS